METDFVCQFCSKILKSKASLARHLKTNKKCAISRDEPLYSEKCEYCKYETANKAALKRHMDNCKHKDEFLKEYRIKYEFLQEERKQDKKLIETLVNKPTVINNTTKTNNQQNLTYNEKVQIYSKVLDPIKPFISKIPMLVDMHFTEENLLSGKDGLTKCLNNILYHDKEKLYYIEGDDKEYRYMDNDMVKIDEKGKYLSQLLQPHMNMQANELVKKIKKSYLYKKEQANLNNDDEEEKLLIEQEKKDLKNANNNITLVRFLGYGKPATNYITVSKFSLSHMKDRRENPLELKEQILKCNNPIKIDIPLEDIMTSMKFITLLNEYNEDVLDIIFENINNYIRFIYETFFNSLEQIVGYFYNYYKDVFWYYEKTQCNGKKIEEKYPDKFYELFFINLPMFYNTNPKGGMYRENLKVYTDSCSIKDPLVLFFNQILEENI